MVRDDFSLMDPNPHGPQCLALLDPDPNCPQSTALLDPDLHWTWKFLFTPILIINYKNAFGFKPPPPPPGLYCSAHYLPASRYFFSLFKKIYEISINRGKQCKFYLVMGWQSQDQYLDPDPH
jgi:hypothetical protein